MLSENHFSVLNAIYLKKMVTPATISDMTSLPIKEVIEQIEESEKLEMLLNLPDGVMLLTEGTQQVVGYYMQHYVNLRTQTTVLQWYENFESLNSRFIANVTDWQKSDGDERLERKLLQCAERLAKDIGQLVPDIPRYAGYVRRFERSMDLVDQGKRDYVCKPTIDSVHNIWFEFHEDILAVLGRPRDTT
jgi:hypothetical protein